MKAEQHHWPSSSSVHMLSSKPQPLSATALVALAAGMTAVMPLAIDVYLIVMPIIARELGASLAETQATMAMFALGFGSSQLFIGWAADRFGRRPVALIGTLGFICASAAVALASDLATLTFSRFIQGVLVAACPILGRTLIRDCVDPARTAKIYSLVNGVSGAVPVCAPLLGATAAALGGWRMAVGIIAIYATVLFLALAWRLPETRPSDTRTNPISPFKAAHEILLNREFQLGASASVLFYSALFTWLSTSPFLMIDGLGFSSTVTALILGGGSAGYMSGSLVSARLTTRFHTSHLIVAGAILMLSGALGAWFVLTRQSPHPVLVLAGILPFYIGIGFAHSNSLQVVMRPFSRIAGQASAWLGVLQQIGGVLVSLLAVQLGAGVNAVIVVAACCTLLLFIALILVRWEKTA